MTDPLSDMSFEIEELKIHLGALRAQRDVLRQYMTDIDPAVQFAMAQPNTDKNKHRLINDWTQLNAQLDSADMEIREGEIKLKELEAQLEEEVEEPRTTHRNNPYNDDL